MLVVSLLCHGIALIFFGFSFDRKISPADYARLSFWGSYAPVADKDIGSSTLHGGQDREGLQAAAQPWPAPDPYLKPAAVINGSKDAEPVTVELTYVRPRREDDAIIFHPVLPYGLTLYFKDRDVAHVELSFCIIPQGSHNSVELTRKISSGNLDADLVCMRYMTHYLFIQQKNFTPRAWQDVKIDLSAHNE